MKKGFLLSSNVDKKNSPSISSFAAAEKKPPNDNPRVNSPSISSSAAVEKKPQNGNARVMKAAYNRDTIVNFTHRRCRTEITRMVDKQAMVRGVVIVRCNACDDLVPVAGKGLDVWFKNRSHDKVERFLLGVPGATVPGKGSYASVCATHETPKACESCKKGDALIAIRFERDHDVVYTHQCKTKMARKVSREAFERGAAVARCAGCNQLCSIADRVDWFGRLKHPSILESFLCKFMADLKQGTEDTFCVTLESMDYLKGKCGSQE